MKTSLLSVSLSVLLYLLYALELPQSQPGLICH
jgi:hypothetical protein